MQSRMEKLKQLIFTGDNAACFIERERILSRLENELRDDHAPDKYPRVLAQLLAEVSTPIHDADYFAGRVVEALPDADMHAPSTLLWSTGHLSPDYEKILRLGLRGILAEIEESARRKGTAQARQFAHNAGIVTEAVKAYADRYAAQAERMGKSEMARALAVVPFCPAYDFYSALQSVWLIHMIASCYVGSRDYAFGRFDRYMFPYYRQALESGETEEHLTELLAGFFVKANEICGRATHNYRTKPTPSHASKQYVNVGGASPNAFSRTVLNAALQNGLAQPQFTVLLRPDADAAFTKQVFDAMACLTDKLHVYHYDLILNVLRSKGIPAHTASDFTFSACSTLDLHYHTYRQEFFVPAPQLFLRVLNERDYRSVDEILAVFSTALQSAMQEYADSVQGGIPRLRKDFVFDCLLLSDSAAECEYPCDGHAPYNFLNLFFPGIATVGDSLMAIDRLVFREKRYPYREFMDTVNRNYEGAEALRREILAMTRFGNNSDSDAYAVRAGNAFLDAADRLTLPENFYAIPGFYSLERDNTWKNEVGATPDGRRAGEPFSENQSPTYGADKNGITALLNSLSKLPLDRTATGALNLTFTRTPAPQTLQALTLAYFSMGGLHVGISVADRAVLRDAMAHPERYPTLTVRLYGFSEYFISLPEWQQAALLNRTAY